METVIPIKIKEGGKIKLVGYKCPRLKVFLKEVAESRHLYRYYDSWNISWEVMKQLDNINGICIYDYENKILYYTPADKYITTKNFISNKKYDKQICLARKHFNKMINVDYDAQKLWGKISEISFPPREAKTSGRKDSPQQTSLV